ncbi:acryloyl-CoA reductase [Paenibacillus albiflavus]|uniref:Acryloyl-CoA reductase n=1 Tax=Paenibacillus albiflavus TaxID=2545760 RepID=A0A4R4EDV4_9BACL|nr:acryloyl-CoA reductase [Paenibacillus albiflavus]TCZ76341.1 acryloyl-CoA reductase [Paenibacillus albiflavus]
MNPTFRALVVNQINEDFSCHIQQLLMNDLPDSDVLIKVSYSSVNYKDGLALSPNGRVVATYPMVPGIDLAGTVVSSKDNRYKQGDQVLVTGYGLGISHYGGYAEYAAVPGDWVVPLPAGLTPKEAMIIGTAGFTAALSIHRLEQNGMQQGKGKVLVTGASGGVGSLAIAMLSKLGYGAIASTGKESEHEFLKQIGAEEIISREAIGAGNHKPLDRQTWAYAIDPVGGKTLAAITSKLIYGGSVAVSGLTGGSEVPTHVYPFILRGVSILGIDSVNCPMELRTAIWKRLASDMKPANLHQIGSKEIRLEQVPEAVTAIFQGKVRGRIVVSHV